MTRLDGWGGDMWGARGLSAVDCVVSAIGASLLLVYFLTWGRKPKSPIDTPIDVPAQ
jgi:hypothetical protein